MAVARDGLFPRVFATAVGSTARPRSAMIVAAVSVDGAGRDELLAEPRRSVHVHHPAGDAQHAGAVHVLFAGRRSSSIGATSAMPWSRARPSFACSRFAYALFAIGGAGAEVVFWGFLLLMGGLPSSPGSPDELSLPEISVSSRRSSHRASELRYAGDLPSTELLNHVVQRTSIRSSSDGSRPTLGQPTAAQLRGWDSILDGRHTLIAAPTGSGKTLAAFLDRARSS